VCSRSSFVFVETELSQSIANCRLPRTGQSFSLGGCNGKKGAPNERRAPNAPNGPEEVVVVGRKFLEENWPANLHNKCQI